LLNGGLQIAEYKGIWTNRKASSLDENSHSWNNICASKIKEKEEPRFMKVKFMGAARTVTGSCYILENQGHRWAIDCGMHQGMGEIEKRNWDTDIYEPRRIEFFLITHAHIDHSGLLPVMVKKGFRGKIYTTPPTRDLLEIMLLDSAHIQEMEAQWRSKKRLRHGGKHIQPLYTQKDAQAVFPLFEDKKYNESFEPCPGLRVDFQDSGHILGASFIELWIKENGTQNKIVFSGDIGRPAQLLVEDPSVIRLADYLFLESTYGDRNHKNEEESLNELSEAITSSYAHKEKVIIPSFAVERAQEVIYSLYLLSKDGRLPRNMPVYLDSPLAIQATEIYRRHPEYLDEPSRKILRKGEDPLSLPQLRYSQTPQESIAINELKGPAVVISASGMAESGRIRHHLRHNLWREGASVVFVGFQALGTTGRKIVDGAKEVRLFNEEIAVKAKIYTINGFSAHAGQTQILDWLSHFHTPGMKILLIHGEYKAQQVLANLIEKRLGCEVCIPDYLEEITLKLGEKLGRVEFPEKAAPQIDWTFLLQDLEAKLTQLRSRKAQLELKEWTEQAEIRDRLLDLNRDLAGIVSEA
jgi:metallo-beta-lactamase family protein